MGLRAGGPARERRDSIELHALFRLSCLEEAVIHTLSPLKALSSYLNLSVKKKIKNQLFCKGQPKSQLALSLINEYDNSQHLLVKINSLINLAQTVTSFQSYDVMFHTIHVIGCA